MSERVRRAWAIFGRRGDIHLDKIMASRAEAWGLLQDEVPSYQLPKADRCGVPVEALKKLGYSCRRVAITWVQP